MYTSFEEIRTKVEELPLPSNSSYRELHWVDVGKIGIAKTSYGAFELFFVGEKVATNSALVERHIEFGRWEGSSGREYDATRVILPRDPHFLAISSLIATECLREGMLDKGATVQSIFRKVEPIIELSLKRGALSDEQLIGLLGELILLEQMLLSVSDSPQLFGEILDMWRGHTPASRDFIIDRTAIEVKTTRSDSSRHYIHGLQQIETKKLPDSQFEEKLYIFSVGLLQTKNGAYSLSTQAERIFELLGVSQKTNYRTVLQNRFLGHLLDYGSSGKGYNHLEMAFQEPYTTTYGMNFIPRLYDLSDPGMLLISTEQLESTFINPKHIEFLVDFPSSVSHENPLPDWRKGINFIIKFGLGIVPQ
jgi:hypothetical protein